MTAKRQYIHPEAAQELVAFQVAAQQAAAHAQAAEVAYRRVATAVAAAMGISKATPKELDADESGMFFVVEEEAAQQRGAPGVGQVDADLLGV